MNRKEREKRNTIIFYTFTFLIGILICIGAFIFAFNIFSNELKNSTITVSSEPTIPKLNTFTALIIKVENDSCEIYNMNTENNGIIKINDAVKIYDKNNSKIPLAKLSAGAIVDIVSDNGEIKSLKMNKDVWEKNHVTNFKIDHDLKTLSCDDKNYSFCSNTLVFSKDNLYDIKKINSLYIVNLKGLGKNIWSIDVKKGCGKITFSNANKIVGGVLKIDDKFSVLLKETNSQKLSEGPHSISLSADNIETYRKDFFINIDENINIDLSGAQFKCGIVKLKINEPGCTVYIDNKKILLTEPIVINYGEYNLKVVKDEFDDYSKKFSVDRDVKEIQVKMKKKINLGTVKIFTTPDNSQIYIDDAYVGLSPTQTSIEYGRHIIYVKKNGYTDVYLPIEVDSPSLSYEINLQKNQ